MIGKGFRSLPIIFANYNFTLSALVGFLIKVKVVGIEGILAQGFCGNPVSIRACLSLGQ